MPKLRRSLSAMLAAAALVGALSVRTLHAAEAPTDSTSSDTPRLIDPSAPPATLVEGGVNAADTEVPDATVLNQPAIEDIELQMNADVLRYIEFFTGAGRSTFERWLKRSGRYMEMFRGVLQKEGLPPDLVHLVFVESGFNVNARSYAAAVGPWQFMRATSRLFGLNVNQWVDERKDPEKATVAAARYLKHLYGIFGDWPLALASYNAGEGTVMRAIKNQGTTNYWELRLPKQTEDYVPQFMAALAITRDPVKYGFGDIARDDPMRFDELALKGAVDLRAIARLADCTFEELKDLNPSVRTSTISSPTGITTLRVPEGKSEVIQRRLNQGAELPRVNLTVHHRVQKGETLASIAKEYSVSPVELARTNHIGRKKPLRRGMLLTVPSSFRAPRPAVLAADSLDPRASTDYVPSRRIGLPGKFNGNSVSVDRVTHTVRRGESLKTIATLYGVSVDDLRRWNHITTPSVKRGTRLRIRNTDNASDSTRVGSQPVTAPSSAAAARAAEAAAVPEAPQMHKVQRGETLTSIATRYQVSVADLRRWNRLGAKGQPKRGTSIRVSGESTADAGVIDAPAQESSRGRAKGATAQRTHVVRAGETLDSIARRHGITVQQLRRANKMTTTRVQAGQRLKLPA